MISGWNALLHHLQTVELDMSNTSAMTKVDILFFTTSAMIGSDPLLYNL
ncbi:hypothetical protein [Candidatus Methanoliparum sp. LAM-1]|nr:hypothetical protein [Candidatus Methanoliparum sp. LAM-1]